MTYMSFGADPSRGRNFALGCVRNRAIYTHVLLPASRVLLKDIKHKLTELETEELSKMAHGFVGADLCLLVKEAGFKAVCRCHTAGLSQTDDLWVIFWSDTDSCKVPTRIFVSCTGPSYSHPR